MASEPSAASDHTDETRLPASYRIRFDGELRVDDIEIDYEKGATCAELHQAVQDAIGFTGVEVLDVTEWEMVP